MKIDFHTGFTTYDFGDNNFLFVDLHPTTDLTFMPRDDIGADLVSVNLARKMKCKAIITTLPRNQQYGIDFNRLPPSEAHAIGMLPKFMNHKFGDTKNYEKRYAWVATDKLDHRKRKGIYNRFWSTVKKSASELSKKGILVFVHVQNPELRNYPSAMDVIPISGLHEARVKKAIEKLNGKYAKEFGRLKKDFTTYLVSYNSNQYKTVLMQMFKSLNPKRFVGAEKENYHKMLNKLKALGFHKEYAQLKNSYSIESHANAIKKVCGKVPPRITYMMNFTGKFALGTRKETKGYKVLEVEMNSFLSEVRTDLAIRILEGLLNEISK
jgi:hypothetical protein